MRRFVILCLSAAISGVLSASEARAWSLFPPAIRVGKPAPDFTAVLLDGRKVSLKDYQGQVLVINFWATWCSPCKRELPLLDGYYQAQQKFGLKVIAATTEDSLPLYQLQPLAKAMSIPMVRYLRGGYGPLEGVPTNYVIDRAGVVRWAQAGAFTLEGLNKLLVPLLREPPPAVVTDPPASAAMKPAA